MIIRDRSRDSDVTASVNRVVSFEDINQMFEQKSHRRQDSDDVSSGEADDAVDAMFGGSNTMPCDVRPTEAAADGGEEAENPQIVTPGEKIIKCTGTWPPVSRTINSLTCHIIFSRFSCFGLAPANRTCRA